jgi:hypothetical protein
MMRAMEADGNFLAKQLAGLSQCEMDIDEIVSECSKSWDTLANRLSQALYFFCNNQVNEGELLEKEKHGLLSLVLPIAGFAHQTNVHVNNHLNTQLTVSWFDNRSKDAAHVLFALIQLALASQRDDIRKGSQTPCLVQVEVPAEGNEPAAIMLSPDQFPQLTNLPGCDPSDHSIEFKKTVFTAQQQAGLVKTAGQITLTNCVLIDDGQALSQLLEMGADDVVLRQLKLYENFPFGTDQALKLVESCNKTIVIGSGTAADLFKQEHLVARLKEKAADGDCVSIDQLESPTLGFIAQLKGALTKKRYRAAMVFVDHASRLSYIHLEQGLTSAETVEAKRAFEAYARSHGVSIKHYHADNGRFADNAFIDSVARSGQTISYYGVNAHFQNGVAEKRIRDLQEQARKQLLHAKSRWPSAIGINLWPYALRTANDIRNTIPDKEDGSSPLERFCRTNVSPKLRHNHTFGCPVYALDNRLQANSRIPKWNPRAQLGINLGSQQALSH